MGFVGTVKVSIEEAKKPYGEVYKIEKNYDAVPVTEWDHFLKRWVWAADRIDRTHIVAEDWATIPDGYCVHCKKSIKHYSTKYYEKHCDNGDRYCYEWSEETAYCEQCAINRSAEGFINNCLPDLVEEVVEMREDYNYYTTKKYADGSELGELTYEEMMAKKEVTFNG